MTFARVWRGRVRRERADEYQAYWLAHGSKPLLDRGAVSVQMLREDRAGESEFVTISYWKSIADMGAGPDPTRTHHLPRDPEFLIEVPEHVQILNVLEAHGSL
jgi:hypothetical protein